MNEYRFNIWPAAPPEQDEKVVGNICQVSFTIIIIIIIVAVVINYLFIISKKINIKC